MHFRTVSRGWHTKIRIDGMYENGRNCTWTRPIITMTIKSIYIEKDFNCNKDYQRNPKDTVNNHIHELQVNAALNDECFLKKKLGVDSPRNTIECMWRGTGEK